MSGYGVTAQFYDAMAAQTHAAIDRQIAEALEPLRDVRDPILDIGAGTGLTTALIAGIAREAEIFAIEPDPVMRAALMTRVWSDADLRQRVTILPMDVLAAPMPDRIAGAVLSASLVHFSPEERRQLWIKLSRRLSPGGRIIVELQAREAVDIPPTIMATAQMGRITYTGLAQAMALPGERQRWTMVYRSEIDGEALDEQTTTYDCWCVDETAILIEARQANLHGLVSGDLITLCGASRFAIPSGKNE